MYGVIGSMTAFQAVGAVRVRCTLHRKQGKMKKFVDSFFFEILFIANLIYVLALAAEIQPYAAMSLVVIIGLIAIFRSSP